MFVGKKSLCVIQNSPWEWVIELVFDFVAVDVEAMLTLIHDRPCKRAPCIQIFCDENLFCASFGTGIVDKQSYFQSNKLGFCD